MDVIVMLSASRTAMRMRIWKVGSRLRFGGSSESTWGRRGVCSDELVIWSVGAFRVNDIQICCFAVS